MKEFSVYRRLIESMTRLDLAENPIGVPQPAQPRQPLQEYKVPVRGKHGLYYRRQKVKQLRPGYKPVGADEQQMSTAPQTQAQQQMTTAPRRPTEEELAIPQKPSQDFMRRAAKRTPTQGQTEQEQTTMELISKKANKPDEQQTSTQATQGTPVPQIDLDALHEDFMKTLKTTTEIGKHPKEYISYHQGRDESVEWHLVPSYPAALAEIERHLGHPMLLGGLLCVAAGFPAYLETRAGYGKTTMAFALKQRIDSLYQRLDKDENAARELANLPFADVIVVEPKTDVTELVGYLYVASVADPTQGRNQDPRIVEDLARFLHAEGRAETIEEARELAKNLIAEVVDTMTGGNISGTTAIAPTAEVRTALERAARWRMPNGRMAKPVLFVYDDAHTPAFLRMIESRLKTALAANTMYGMPYLTVSHLLFANPNEEEVSSEFASRLMPWITPANVTSEYGLRGKPDVSELIRTRGRAIAKVALKKALGKSIDQIDTSEILKHADAIQKAFDEEVKERLESYGLTRDEEDAITKMRAVEYLTDDLGTPHYMGAIATAVSQAGLDAVTAGWQWRPDDEVDEENIYSQYLETPGFRAAYTPEELMDVAERHAAFARAVHWNDSMALTLFSNPSNLPAWKKVKNFIDAHLSSGGEKINWYNERSAMKRNDTIVAGPDRSPRDWQRFVSLSALFGAMGRPDMVAYTIGMIGGINPEVPMPKITVNDSPGAIDRKLDEYFTAQNLSQSVQAMLRGQKLTPEEYAEGLKQYARAVIFTTQAESGAGEHTIYSILKPHIETILRHGKQKQQVSAADNLAYRIAVGRINLTDHNTNEIHRNTPWYQAHRSDFKELLDNLYRKYMSSGATKDGIRENAEAAHAALSILAGLMRSMHATNAIGSQERNAILKSAKHAREQLVGQEGKSIRGYLSSAARMAAALRRFSETGDHNKLSEQDKKELHKFGHLVAFAHAKDSQGNFVLPEEKLKDIEDLVETVHGIATTGSGVRAGASAAGVGSFAPLTEKRWSAEFADALANILRS